MESVKEDPDIAAQLAMAGVSNVPMVWSQAPAVPLSAPQAHMATVSTTIPVVPPPAHAHPSSTNQKPPDTFLDKGLLEAAAFLDGKAMSLPGKGVDSASTSDGSGGSLPWQIQNSLLQQYGQLFLDRMLNKQPEGGTTATATATTDTVATTQHAPQVTASQGQVLPKAEPENADPNSLEAHRDVYRRMLNYSSALTQQYYLSQYGYNYMQALNSYIEELGPTIEETVKDLRTSVEPATSTQSDTDASDDNTAQSKSISACIDAACSNIAEEEDTGRPSTLEEVKLGCKCATYCLDQFSKDSIQHHIQCVRDMKKDERDMLVMNSLITFGHGMTRRGKRQRNRYRYTHEDKVVCKTSFCYIYNISIKTLKALQRHLVQNGPVPRIHGNKGRKPYNALSYEEVKFCVEYLLDYTNKHGNPMPEAPSEPNEFPPVWLPSVPTKQSIHSWYCEACTAVPIRALGLSSFKDVWYNCLPHVHILGPKDDIASKCEEIKLKKQMGKMSSDQEKTSATMTFIDQIMLSKNDGNQTTSTTSTAGANSQSAPSGVRGQLPSIDSVLLNLSTKKTSHGSATTTEATPTGLQATASSVSSVPAYGLQALANAAIEADPKGFSEADTDKKDGQKSELSDITDTDDSNMSPSDSSTGQILSPSRNTYSHLLDTNPHISIPAAHSHQYQSVYQSKSAMGTLPGIQHFSTSMGKVPQKQGEPAPHNVLPISSAAIKPSDLVAAAMKLKVEPSEEREKEIADRTIQERIAAHQLNAVQQQVQDLTAGSLSAGSLDAAALLAKLPLGVANLESDLHRHMERVYDYDPETLHSLQQEPIELTSEGSPGKANSRRKSRGRPTSIESLRDPLARQSSTSSLGGATSLSGDGEDRTYDCEICGKQFSHNDRLRRHRKIHTAEKPYKCDICGKGFKEKCNLKHHRFIHTGEKPYKCDTCGKSFNQRSSLKTHQKVHTGEKPFKCELCEKPFAQKYLLRQHMKKHIEINMPTAQ